MSRLLILAVGTAGALAQSADIYLNTCNPSAATYQQWTNTPNKTKLYITERSNLCE
jgi:hypothetical protein